MVRSELYAILALAMRYVFCALLLIIVFRAWRITVVDNRRARILRMIMPDVASVGELIAQGNLKGKRRARFLIPSEGILGSSGGADICIRHADVKRKHAFFSLRDGGLLIRPLRGATLTLENGANARQLILKDGDRFLIGKLKVQLVLFDAIGKHSEVPDEREPEIANDLPVLDEFFEEEDLWQEAPAKSKKTRKK